MVPGIGGEVVFEVIGNRFDRFQAHQGVGPAGVAAAILDRCAFEHDDAGTSFRCRNRSRQPGDAVADDNQIIMFR